MERNTRYEVKADRWEFAAAVAARVLVFVAASVFIFMIFQDAYLIRLHQPSVDPSSYAESHIYIVLVEVVLWTIIARAAIRFKAYARHIRGSKDGSALNLIANAMLLSFIYAILFDMASTFKTLFMGTASLRMVTTVTNLLPLLVFLVLSVSLFVGSARLARLVPRGAGFSRRQQRLAVLCLAVFVLLIVPFGEYFYHVVPQMMDDDGLRHFTLSSGVLVGTYLLPFIVVWLLGLLSCLNLAKYAYGVQGKIYRQYFCNLCTGILIAYLSTYLIQIFYVSNAPSNHLGFGLIFILSLIAMLIVGYSLIYRGANQLYMLESNPSS